MNVKQLLSDTARERNVSEVQCHVAISHSICIHRLSRVYCYPSRYAASYVRARANSIFQRADCTSAPEISRRRNQACVLKNVTDRVYRTSQRRETALTRRDGVTRRLYNHFGKVSFAGGDGSWMNIVCIIKQVVAKAKLREQNLIANRSERLPRLAISRLIMLERYVILHDDARVTRSDEIWTARSPSIAFRPCRRRNSLRTDDCWVRQYARASKSPEIVERQTF